MRKPARHIVICAALVMPVTATCTAHTERAASAAGQVEYISQEERLLALVIDGTPPPS